jgi:hypothetical protein
MARAKKLKCSTRYSSFGFGGLSPIKQCTKPAVVRETYTDLYGKEHDDLRCSRHRALITETLTKSFKAEEL